MTKKIESTKKNNKKETLVYCGPSFPGELDQYAVFKGKLPAHVQKHITEYPIIKRLFVNIKDFPKFKLNIRVPGKKENQLYNKVLEYQKGAK